MRGRNAKEVSSVDVIEANRKPTLLEGSHLATFGVRNNTARKIHQTIHTFNGKLDKSAMDFVEGSLLMEHSGTSPVGLPCDKSLYH